MENTIEIKKQGSKVQTHANKEIARPYFEAMREQAVNGKEFPKGANKAYWAWYYSDCQGEVVMKDFLWENDIHDFISTMRTAGVGSFIFANSSTAVMNNLHGFVMEGCKLENLVSIERDVTGNGEWIEKEEGIRISL